MLLTGEMQQKTLGPLGRVPYEACPLCDSKDFRSSRIAGCKQHPLWQPPLPETIEWLECRACGHSFTSGYFDEAAQKVLFSRTQASQEPGYDIENQRRIAADMVDRLMWVTAKDSGDWLDVGCGSGSLLTTAAEYGFRAFGIELRRSSAEALCRLGYPVSRTPLERTTETEKWDVMSLCDVVEHVPFPGQLLAKARERMAPEGAILVSCPNTDSFVWKALDAAHQNPYWAELEHYHNFSRTSLYRLLEQHGFEPVSYGISKRYRACCEVIARAV